MERELACWRTKRAPTWCLRRNDAYEIVSNKFPVSFVTHEIAIRSRGRARVARFVGARQKTNIETKSYECRHVSLGAAELRN